MNSMKFSVHRLRYVFDYSNLKIEATQVLKLLKLCLLFYSRHQYPSLPVRIHSMRK